MLLAQNRCCAALVNMGPAERGDDFPGFEERQASGIKFRVTANYFSADLRSSAELWA
jgi:hypothetical protein